MKEKKTYAVFGLGKYGMAVAKELVANGAEVLAVDMDMNLVNEASVDVPYCKCADITDPEVIKKNLVAQLTAPVKWTQSVQNMVADGMGQLIECGPGAVLQGLVKKIEKTVEATAIEKL